MLAPVFPGEHGDNVIRFDSAHWESVGDDPVAGPEFLRLGDQLDVTATCDFCSRCLLILQGPGFSLRLMIAGRRRHGLMVMPLFLQLQRRGFYPREFYTSAGHNFLLLSHKIDVLQQGPGAVVPSHLIASLVRLFFHHEPFCLIED